MTAMTAITQVMRQHSRSYALLRRVKSKGDASQTTVAIFSSEDIVDTVNLRCCKLLGKGFRVYIRCS